MESTNQRIPTTNHASLANSRGTFSTIDSSTLSTFFLFLEHEKKTSSFSNSDAKPVVEPSIESHPLRLAQLFCFGRWKLLDCWFKSMLIVWIFVLFSLCEVTVTDSGIIKQRRLPDQLQNLAERIGVASRCVLTEFFFLGFLFGLVFDPVSAKRSPRSVTLATAGLPLELGSRTRNDLCHSFVFVTSFFFGCSMQVLPEEQPEHGDAGAGRVGRRADAGEPRPVPAAQRRRSRRPADATGLCHLHSGADRFCLSRCSKS